MTADRGLAVIAAAAILVASCGGGEPYFQQPSEMGVGLPAGVGEMQYIGVAWLISRSEEDDVRLLSAEPIEPDLGPADLTWLALRLEDGDGGIGAVDETDGHVRHLVPLAGAIVPFGPWEYPTVATQVVVGILSEEPAIVRFGSVRVRFTVNGSLKSQDFPMTIAVCVAQPRPLDCDAATI